MKAALLLSLVAGALASPISLNPTPSDIQSTGPANTTQITFLPTYANQTTNGWNVRLYGFAYNSTTSENNTFSDYVSDATIKVLEAAANGTEEKANLTRNLQPFLYANYLSGINITVSLDNQTVTTPQPTNFTGVFNEFVTVPNVTQSAGSVVDFAAVSPVANANSTGNVTLVPPTGYSVISDIDDVLRQTEIWNPILGLENTFLKPYVPVPDMPQLFSQWNNTLPNATFHYGTTTPIPLASQYIQWLSWNYPYGSLDMRPMDITHPDEILEARQDQLTELVETFPNRTFIMIGDTSSTTLLKAYPNFARQYPNQTACIFIRNITATYPNFNNPLMDLQQKFQGVPPEKWFVFDNATSLMSVNVTSGNCHPAGIPPNQTSQSGGF